MKEEGLASRRNQVASAVAAEVIPREHRHALLHPSASWHLMTMGGDVSEASEVVAATMSTKAVSNGHQDGS